MQHHLPNRIKELRTEAGISQQAIAEKIGTVTKQQIGKIERGQHELTHRWMRRIAAVLSSALGRTIVAGELLPPEDQAPPQSALDMDLLHDLVLVHLQWQADHDHSLTAETMTGSIAFHYERTLLDAGRREGLRDWVPESLTLLSRQLSTSR